MQSAVTASLSKTLAGVLNMEETIPIGNRRATREGDSERCDGVVLYMEYLYKKAAAAAILR